MPYHPIKFVRCLCLALTLQLLSEVPSRGDAVSSAENYCSNYRTPISADNAILCFDGTFERNIDLAVLRKLKNNGFFVVRSVGGDVITAMKISEILLQKSVTVVIRDYCLSACANTILIASKKSYVLSNTIVAWHGGTPKLDCRAPDVVVALTSKSDIELREEKRVLQRFCSHFELVDNFYKKRGIDDRFTMDPQTLYTRKMFDIALQAAANKSSVFWMWNPKNHRDYFDNKIAYGSYPDSQYAVDEIIRRQRLPIRVIYDPEQQ